MMRTKRKILSALLALALVAAPLMVSAASPGDASRQAITSPVVGESVMYRIRNKNTDKYLTVNGTKLVTTDKNSTPSQLFRVEYDAGKNAYQMISNTKPELAVTGGTLQAGAAVTLETNTGADNQWWLMREYSARNMITCYANWDCNLLPGNTVTLGDLSKSRSFQIWDFEQVGKLAPGRYRIYNQQSKGFLQYGWRIDGDDFLLTSDEIPVMEKMQEWIVGQEADGTYTISSVSLPGYYLQDFIPTADAVMAQTKCSFVIAEFGGAYRIMCNGWNTAALGTELGESGVVGVLGDSEGQDWVFMKI